VTKFIASLVLASSILAGAAQAAPISSPSDFAVHGAFGIAYGQ
jgi:hypothetical protein